MIPCILLCVIYMLHLLFNIVILASRKTTQKIKLQSNDKDSCVWIHYKCDKEMLHYSKFMSAPIAFMRAFRLMPSKCGTSSP